MTREELKSLISDKIDKIYYAYQTSEHINSGDIIPDDAFELDDIEDRLADLIIKSMEHNKVQFDGDIQEDEYG